MKTIQPKISVEKEYVSNYQKGLDNQRENFKNAKFRNDYDGMADALENIKSEIKSKIISNSREKELDRIERILNWYRTKESKFIVRTPDGGHQIRWPSDMPVIVNRHLTSCFELLITELDKLGLL